MAFPPDLAPLLAVEARTVRRAQRLASIALLLATGLGALHVARAGTERARITAVLLIVGVGVGLVLWSVYRRRARRDPEGLIRRVVVGSQPARGGRLLRAYRLRHVASHEQSRALVELHYAQTLAAVDPSLVERLVRERARLIRRFAVACFALTTLAAVYAPLRVLEGADVLFARDGYGAFPIPWLDRVAVDAEPPSYLGMSSLRLTMQSGVALPEGTVITVRGKPLARGRHLVLTDGQREVPFSAEGSGDWVARWELERSGGLIVAARLGDVLIPGVRAIELHALPDLPPEVKLAEAPKTVELQSLRELSLAWSARDDHNLVQVDLVLRSAGREERRPLERYPSDKRFASGGHVLRGRDPFFRRLFLPAEVTIEARDNDPRVGNKWGKSAAITVRPPGVGAPALERYRALAAVRRHWAELLAARVRLGERPTRREREAFSMRFEAMRTETLSAANQSYSGLSVPARWSAFARGQLDSLRQAYQRRRDEVRATEVFLLAFDRGVEALVEGDARRVSKQLGDVAEEGALAARMAQSLEQRSEGERRLQAALGVLKLGIVELKQLGLLGSDVGSVAQGDLGRVLAAQAKVDIFHAELALLHMAARLHRPNPSFGAKGGSGGGGVEAGPGMGGGSGGEAEGDASDAPGEFERALGELQRLAQEHAESVARTSSALKEAEDAVPLDDLRQEAEARAEALRQSVASLPAPGAAPGTGEASASLVREHAGAMAHELGRLGLDEAVESGRRALSALDAAERSGDLSPRLQDALRAAREQLAEQLAWTREMAERRRALRQQAAREQLQKVGEFERELAERTERLGQPSEDANGLPEDTVQRLQQAEQLMRDAARRLRSGEGESALDIQRSAQRLLEDSDPEQAEEEPGDSSDSASEGAEGAHPAQGGTVPGAEAENPAEAFRKRVLRGLGRAEGNKLSPAVRRYAEGLLQ